MLILNKLLFQNRNVVLLLCNYLYRLVYPNLLVLSYTILTTHNVRKRKFCKTLCLMSRVQCTNFKLHFGTLTFNNCIKRVIKPKDLIVHSLDTNQVIEWSTCWLATTCCLRQNSHRIPYNLVIEFDLPPSTCVFMNKILCPCVCEIPLQTR